MEVGLSHPQAPKPTGRLGVILWFPFQGHAQHGPSIGPFHDSQPWKVSKVHFTRFPEIECGTNYDTVRRRLKI